MPWRPAKPPSAVRLSLTDRLSSIPAVEQLNEIEPLFDGKLGKPYIPTGNTDRRYMKEFYAACKQQVDEASKSRKQPGRPLLFILTSSSSCVASTNVDCAAFDAIVVTAGLVEVIHRESAELARHALAAGLHRTRSVARSLVNRLGHSRDTAAMLAAFIGEMWIGLVVARELARIGSRHVELQDNDMAIQQARQFDADVQAIFMLTRRAEGHGRLGALLPDLVGVPLFEWLKEDAAHGAWLMALALSMLGMELPDVRYTTAAGQRLLRAFEAQHRISSALHPEAAFNIRDLQDEALTALSACKHDPSIRTVQADRYDNAGRVLTQTFVRTLSDAWIRGQMQGSAHTQFTKESVVEWWLDQASHPAAADNRQVAAASFG